LGAAARNAVLALVDLKRPVLAKTIAANYHVGVFVNNLADLPPAIDDEVRRMLGIES
jgi:hypothetical protein